MRPRSWTFAARLVGLVLLLAAAPAAAVSFETFVALGDSLTKAQTNPVPHVARQIGVPLHNLAVNGATTTSLLAGGQVEQAAALDPTFATLWIGGNDIKNDPLRFIQRDWDEWLGNYQIALDGLIATGADVITANMFNVARAPFFYGVIPNPTQDVLDIARILTEQWNDRIAQIAGERGVPVVDVFSVVEAMATGGITIAGNEFILAPASGLGMHLFNPPNVIIGCELIPHAGTDPEVTAFVADYLTSKLGRELVKTSDTPAFCGNRVGFKVLNECAQLAVEHGTAYIDALIGPHTGRAMAPLATVDFVGWDVHKAIVDNLHANTRDEAHAAFAMPAYMDKLVAAGHLGNKTKDKGGFFRADGKAKLVGDCDFASCEKVAGSITPVPGGVGPMTIACLLHNTVRAACQQKGIATPQM